MFLWCYLHNWTSFWQNIPLTFLQLLPVLKIMKTLKGLRELLAVLMTAIPQVTKCQSVYENLMSLIFLLICCTHLPCIKVIVGEKVAFSFLNAHIYRCSHLYLLAQTVFNYQCFFRSKCDSLIYFLCPPTPLPPPCLGSILLKICPQWTTN